MSRVSRENVLARLHSVFSALPYVYVMWQGGAAAFGRVDELSDIDVHVVTDGDRISEMFKVAEDTLLSLSGSKARVVVDPDRYRPAPPERLALVGDPARLRRLGWSAELSFEETLRDLLEDWRERD